MREVLIVAGEDVNLEDIKRVFNDHRIMANDKNYIYAEFLPASVCNVNDKHILFLKKKQ